MGGLPSQGCGSGPAVISTLAAVKVKTDLIGTSVALESGGNLAAVKAKTDLIGTSVALESGGNLAAVKVKTDLIGTSVALESGGNLAAVKAKTDLIPAAPAAQAKLDSSLYTSRLAEVNVEAALPAGPVNVFINIQPPVGETWDIIVMAGIKSNIAEIGYVAIEYYDGATAYGGASTHTPSDIHWAGSTETSSGVTARLRITSAMYCRLIFWHDNATVLSRYGYSYFGWKE